jgi:chorismate mutase/prephenate dehydratase
MTEALQELQTLRHQIDALDDQIAELIEQRSEIARAIGTAKGSAPVYDPLREEAVLERLTQNHPDIPSQALRAIQREIISHCRSLQHPLKVACLGPEGSFSHQAAQEQFGSQGEVLFCGDFDEVLSLLYRDEADMAMLPVENTVEGAVCPALDALTSAPEECTVLCERRVPVKHMLASISSLEEVTTVCSHPQALSQCRRWIATHLPGRKILPLSSTSAAAEHARSAPECAAICTVIAAESRGLPIVARHIQDSPHNITRFWTIGKGKSQRGEKNKTSFRFTVPHTPGSLFAALEPLVNEPLNLTFIESRPLLHNPFEYSFFVDVEGHLEDPSVYEALEAVRSLASGFRFLGSYPCIL